MRKLRLELDGLTVESFIITAEARDAAGTVRGREKTLQADTCGVSCDPCGTCDTSCAGGPYCDCPPSGCPSCQTSCANGPLCDCVPTPTCPIPTPACPDA